MPNNDIDRLGFSKANRIRNRIDLQYGSTDWKDNPEYMAKHEKAVRRAEKRLKEKAASRTMGETPKSKIVQAEMADVPRQTLAEELGKGDPVMTEEFEKQQMKASEKLALERRAQVERRIIQGAPPAGTSERRDFDRRQGIQEIKRLKGELSADAARKAVPGGRDTLVRNIPKIEERIAGTRARLIESAPGPSTTGIGRLAGVAKLGGKALGVTGTALNVVEHWRAANAVGTEENKDAPWADRFAAYSERVLGMQPGASGRRPLPSEARSANSI